MVNWNRQTIDYANSLEISSSTQLISVSSRDLAENVTLTSENPLRVNSADNAIID